MMSRRYALPVLSAVACFALVGCQSSSSPGASAPATATATSTATAPAPESSAPSATESSSTEDTARTPMPERARGAQVTRNGLTYDAATRACDARGQQESVVADWNSGLLLSKVGGDTFVLKVRVSEGAQDGRNVLLCKVRGSLERPEVVSFTLTH